MVRDCFELLNLPQAILLDDAVLKERYHAAAMEQRVGAEEINQAYAVLKEPSQRIAHLLGLQGRNVESMEKPGTTLFDLFFCVGAALKKSDDLSALFAETSTALERAGLTTRVLTNLDELTFAGGKIAAEKSARFAVLTSLAAHLPNLSDGEWDTLALLGNDLAFLSKWEREIQKRETRLQETLIGAMN